MSPPPPPLLPYYLKTKKKFVAEEPMKKLNWTPIKPQNILQKSIWVMCQGDELVSGEIFAELSANFSMKPTEKTDNVLKAKPSTKSIDLQVLDRKSAQNILIFKRAFLKHTSNEQIRKSILRCETPVEIVEGLIQCLPKPDQLKRFEEIKKNVNHELSEAEEFVANLCGIEGLVPRLHSMIFKLNFFDMVEDLEPDIIAATDACKEIRASKKFATILQLILIVGNYMNSWSKNGPAFGFEMKSLTQLTDTKNSGNELTLLQYVVDMIKRKFPDLLKFGDEMPHIEKVSRVDSGKIQETMLQMTTSLEELECGLANSKVPQSPDDKFVENMGGFAARCKDRLEVLAEKKNHLESSYQELVEYFSFDTNQYPMEALFSDIKSFKKLYEKACKENVKFAGIRDILKQV